jgi:hypothetical protein
MGKVRRTVYDVAIGTAAESGGDSGRAASAAAFAAFEKLVRQINTLRFGTGSVATLIGVMFAVMFFLDDSQHFVSNKTGGWAIVATAMVAFAAVSSWPIIWLIPLPKCLQAIVFADGLQPFHKVREDIASGQVIAGRPDGGIHSAPLFESPWALTAFSRNEDVRHMRLPGSRTGVLDEPLIEIDDNEPEPDIEERFVVAASLDRVANRLEIVEKVVAEVSQAKDRPQKPRRLHWFAGVTEELFLARVEIIASHWEGLKEQQILIALKTTFDYTRPNGNPYASVKQICQKVQRAFAENGLPKGLGKPKDAEKAGESDAALRKLFEAGAENDYAWVRQSLLDPDYVPKQLNLTWR